MYGMNGPLYLLKLHADVVQLIQAQFERARARLHPKLLLSLARSRV